MRIPARIKALILLTAATGCLGFRSFFNHGSGHYELTLKALDGIAASRQQIRLNYIAARVIAGNSEIPDHPWEFAYAEEDHFDNESFDGTIHRPGAAQKILSHRNEVLRLARAGRADAAWLELGIALHTIGDFYSHSSWVDVRDGEANHSNVVLFLDSLKYPGQPPPGCANDGRLNNSANVTSTYFQEEFANPNPPFVVDGIPKCVHGGIMTNWEGVGYDRDDPDDPRHMYAASTAVIAMRKFVQAIVDELERAETIGDDRAVCTLLHENIEMCDRLSSGAIEVWRIDAALVSVDRGATFMSYDRSATGTVTTKGLSLGSASVSISDILCREGAKWIPKHGSRDFEHETRRWSVDAAGNFEGTRSYSSESDNPTYELSEIDWWRVKMNLDTIAPFSGHGRTYSRRLEKATGRLTVHSHSSTIPERYEYFDNNLAIPMMEKLRTLPEWSIIPPECTRSPLLP